VVIRRDGDPDGEQEGKVSSIDDDQEEGILMTIRRESRIC
jgi:hypothetical protein